LVAAADELSQLVEGGGRAIVVSSQDVDLKSMAGVNSIFVLKLAEGSLAAGGRGGGFGERRVVRVCRFRYADGGCEKLLDTADESSVSQFEIPYHVARLPLILGDGNETMGYGVVDPELVAQFEERASSLSQLK
jgi:hypothetical protein